MICIRQKWRPFGRHFFTPGFLFPLNGSENQVTIRLSSDTMPAELIFPQVHPLFDRSPESALRHLPDPAGFFSLLTVALHVLGRHKFHLAKGGRLHSKQTHPDMSLLHRRHIFPLKLLVFRLCKSKSLFEIIIFCEVPFFIFYLYIPKINCVFFQFVLIYF